MAPRVSADDQARIDRGWDEALAPVDRLTRAEWLDVFVGAGVFEAGVDKLDFRSEKRFAGGVVVMEVHFERADPSRDRFTMEVVDKKGVTVRRESFSRDDVTTTGRALFRQEPNEDPAVRKAREDRWAVIRRYFPEKDSGSP
jgi:hypothetical protein